MLYTEKVVRCYTQITSSISLVRCLQHIFARLEDVFYVLEEEKLLRRRRTEDVFKTCLEHVSKTSWRQARVICI